MVRHGAGQLLVQLVAHTDPLKDADVRKRASAAFRNLLCVSVSYVYVVFHVKARAIYWERGGTRGVQLVK